MSSILLPALADCLGDLPKRRDLLIEALHRVRDAFGELSPDHLRWVADAYGVSEVEVYEVVSFYDFFSSSGAGTHLRLCSGPACEMAGGRQLESALAGQGTRVGYTPCIGACDQAPAALVGGRRHAPFRRLPSRRQKWVEQGFEPSAPVGPGRDRRIVLEHLEASGLRGMGGAGYPTAAKWRNVLARPGPPYLIVNADESEPGAFKDRRLLETAAGQVLTGALVAAQAINARRVIFYLRGEYGDLLTSLISTADALRENWPRIEFDWRRGAGSYVCGEETALIESIEGRPAHPRHKPPYPTELGLFGEPTLVQNVETLFWVNEILARGGDWYAAQGTRGGQGVRWYSVSGRVARPGVYVAPCGVTISELIQGPCEGMAAGHELAAFLPGGAAGGILPASLAHLPLTPESLEPHGASLGSASVIVLSEKDRIHDVVSQLMGFFTKESCGQCAPCRLGTNAAHNTLKLAPDRVGTLSDYADALALGSICGLGHGAGRLLAGYLRHFTKRGGHNA